MKITNTFSVCRLCMCLKDPFINIFEINSISGNCPAPVIADLFNVDVTESDRYPKVVCKLCLLKIGDFKEFKETCLKSIILFDKQLEDTEGDCISEVDKEDNNIAEVPEHATIKEEIDLSEVHLESFESPEERRKRLSRVRSARRRERLKLAATPHKTQRSPPKLIGPAYQRVTLGGKTYYEKVQSPPRNDEEDVSSMDEKYSLINKEEIISEDDSPSTSGTQNPLHLGSKQNPASPLLLERLLTGGGQKPEKQNSSPVSNNKSILSIQQSHLSVGNNQNLPILVGNVYSLESNRQFGKEELNSSSDSTTNQQVASEKVPYRIKTNLEDEGRFIKEEIYLGSEMTLVEESTVLKEDCIEAGSSLEYVKNETKIIPLPQLNWDVANVLSADTTQQDSVRDNSEPEKSCISTCSNVYPLETTSEQSTEDVVDIEEEQISRLDEVDEFQEEKYEVVEGEPMNRLDWNVANLVTSKPIPMIQQSLIGGLEDQCSSSHSYVFSGEITTQQERDVDEVLKSIDEHQKRLARERVARYRERLKMRQQGNKGIHKKLNDDTMNLNQEHGKVILQSGLSRNHGSSGQLKQDIKVDETPLERRRRLARERVMRYRERLKAITEKKAHAEESQWISESCSSTSQEKLESQIDSNAEETFLEPLAETPVVKVEPLQINDCEESDSKETIVPHSIDVSKVTIKEEVCDEIPSSIIEKEPYKHTRGEDVDAMEFLDINLESGRIDHSSAVEEKQNRISNLEDLQCRKESNLEDAKYIKEEIYLGSEPAEGSGLEEEYLLPEDHNAAIAPNEDSDRNILDYRNEASSSVAKGMFNEEEDPLKFDEKEKVNFEVTETREERRRRLARERVARYRERLKHLGRDRAIPEEIIHRNHQDSLAKMRLTEGQIDPNIEQRNTWMSSQDNKGQISWQSNLTRSRFVIGTKGDSEMHSERTEQESPKERKARLNRERQRRWRERQNQKSSLNLRIDENRMRRGSYLEVNNRSTRGMGIEEVKTLSIRTTTREEESVTQWKETSQEHIHS